MMKLEKHNITSPALLPFSQFIWHLTSDEPVAEGKLLPVVNTDLLISVSTPVYYYLEDEKPVQTPPVHIRNIKLRPQFVTQAAGCDVWGISLAPYGAYSFVGNMSGLTERVIELCAEQSYIYNMLRDGLRGLPETSDCITLIEEQIGKLVKASIPDNDRAAMDGYLSNMSRSGVVEYCEAAGIGVKRLERLFKKYTGMTPKQLQRIARFQQAGNELIYNDEPPPLADIAYNNEYADQTHFNRSFRKYAGVTPFAFMSCSDSIKAQIRQKK